MKTVYLNHLESQPLRLNSWSGWLGWLLLLAGLLALAAVLLLLHQTNSANADLQQRIATRATAPARRVSAVPDAKLEVAKTAIQHIVTPWASLLKTLETVNIDSVKMLALEPNVKARTVKLNLVALNQASMWAYLEGLKQQAALHNVHLVTNETVELNGAPALAFQVEATWRM